MIGDWVKFEGDIFKVLCIDYVCGIVNLKSENKAIAKDISCILEPIPITEKILVDNGFEKSEIVRYSAVNEEFVNVVGEVNVYMYKEKEIWLLTSDNIPCVKSAERTAHFFIGMNYVHELQHILRFLNIDLEIEL